MPDPHVERPRRNPDGLRRAYLIQRLSAFLSTCAPLACGWRGALLLLGDHKLLPTTDRTGALPAFELALPSEIAGLLLRLLAPGQLQSILKAVIAQWPWGIRCQVFKDLFSDGHDFLP